MIISGKTAARCLLRSRTATRRNHLHTSANVNETARVSVRTVFGRRAVFALGDDIVTWKVLIAFHRPTPSAATTAVLTA